MEQKRDFLLNAKVIGSRQTNRGITNPYRLTLSDGKITHDASYQGINERRSYKELERGNEVNFVDSFLYNLAAYELAKLIGIFDGKTLTAAVGKYLNKLEIEGVKKRRASKSSSPRKAKMRFFIKTDRGSMHPSRSAIIKPSIIL